MEPATKAPPAPKPKRIRGRRSSKPAMEKKRRARINQCLDILKSYVLNDSNNLIQLGIDTNATENQTEENIAKHILTSSGLINRHRGRKNTNKLEKADILELTVDYVRRLHIQRNELILNQQNSNKRLPSMPISQPLTNPISLNCPLPTPPNIPRLTNNNNSCMRAGYTASLGNILPSPPSSASSSPQPLLAISSNIQFLRAHHQNHALKDSPPPISHHRPPTMTSDPNQMMLSDVLDLSDLAKKSRLSNGNIHSINDAQTKTISQQMGNQQQPLYSGTSGASWQQPTRSCQVWPSTGSASVHMYYA